MQFRDLDVAKEKWSLRAQTRSSYITDVQSKSQTEEEYLNIEKFRLDNLKYLSLKISK